MAAEAGRVEPAPRRVRGFLDRRQVFDTTHARYVWEWSNYPQYYVPLEDVDVSLLVDEQHEQRLRFGVARTHGLRTAGQQRTGSVRAYGADALPGVAGTARFDWAALDALVRGGRAGVRAPPEPVRRGLTPSARIAMFASSSTVSCSPSPRQPGVGLRDRASDPLLHRPARRPVRAPSSTPPPRPHARTRASHPTIGRCA